MEWNGTVEWKMEWNCGMENGMEWRLATVPCMGPRLLLLRKAATRVVRTRRDRGSRYTDHR